MGPSDPQVPPEDGIDTRTHLVGGRERAAIQPQIEP